MAKKNKQKQGRKKFLVGRKKTKALLHFLAMARCGDWAEKNANVLCLWVGFFPLL
ncbi:MAG: hypothetical protein ACK455_04675 [Bacteroidota bacterium]